MPPTGFEPATPVSDRPQTLILDRSATGIRYLDHPARSQSLYRLSYRGPWSLLGPISVTTRQRFPLYHVQFIDLSSLNSCHLLANIWTLKVTFSGKVISTRLMGWNNSLACKVWRIRGKTTHQHFFTGCCCLSKTTSPLRRLPICRTFCIAEKCFAFSASRDQQTRETLISHTTAIRDHESFDGAYNQTSVAHRDVERSLRASYVVARSNKRVQRACFAVLRYGQQYRQCTYNVTLRCICVTIVAVEKQ